MQLIGQAIILKDTDKEILIGALKYYQNYFNKIYKDLENKENDLARKLYISNKLELINTLKKELEDIKANQS